jgi:hypothetical protein
MHQHRFGYLMCAVSCNIILLRDFICAYIYMVTSNVTALGDEVRRQHADRDVVIRHPGLVPSDGSRAPADHC